MLLTKAIEAKIGDQGSVEAVFSTFDIVDRDGDVVTRDALLPYDGQEVPMVSSHDWSLDGWIGKGTIHVGQKDARFVGQFMMDDEDGAAAFKKVKAFAGLSQWSWAFRVSDSSWEQKDGNLVRIIKGLAEKPYEVSPVLVGANPVTPTVGIKSLDETKATWDASYVNDLPDSAFAVILPSGTKDDEGKTTPRDLRKLPHHADGGSVDVPHLRNALSREPQTDMSEAEHARAKAHLDRHAAAEGIGTDDTGKALARVLVEIDHLEDEIKAGATLSGQNMQHVHDVLKAAMALHDVGTCAMGDSCPLAPMEKAASPASRETQMRELEAALASVKL